MVSDYDPGHRLIRCDCGWSAAASGLAEAAVLLFGHAEEARCSTDNFVICRVCHQPGGQHWTLPHANRPRAEIRGVDDALATAALNSRAQACRNS
jgi:hypothetical protein